MNRHLIHTPGDLIVVMGDDGRPRAYEVEPDGSLTEKNAAAVALYSARQTTDVQEGR